MRCCQCGKEMYQISGECHKTQEGYWQTTRTYKCRKCGKTQTETDEPVKDGGNQ